MQISLREIGKRYAYQTILKKVSLDIENGSRIGISGRNGAGKSTLLKILSGYLSPSAGDVTYLMEGKKIADENWHQHFVFAAPYIDLPPYFTIGELLAHYAKFKKVVRHKPEEFIDYCELSHARGKRIGQLSSGMQQKLALGLAFNTEASVFLLDEPTSYLDQHAKRWFRDRFPEIQGATTIIASNDDDDFFAINHLYEVSEKTLQKVV